MKGFLGLNPALSLTVDTKVSYLSVLSFLVCNHITSPLTVGSINETTNCEANITAAHQCLISASS
jgi:hypothetical protein